MADKLFMDEVAAPVDRDIIEAAEAIFTVFEFSGIGKLKHDMDALSIQLELEDLGWEFVDNLNDEED